MKINIQWAVALFITLCTFQLMGEVSANTSPLFQTKNLHWQVEHLKESSMIPLKVDQVRVLMDKGAFKPFEAVDNNINLDFSTFGRWLRVVIDYPGEVPATWVLELAYQSPDQIDLYLPENIILFAGALRPRPKQQLEHPFLAFPIRLSPGSNELLMRVQSASALTMPLRIWTPDKFLQHVQFTSVLQAFYFGAVAAIIIYNLFLTISLNDRRFGLYVIFSMMMGMAMLSGNGYGRLYLWPDAFNFDRVSQSLFLSLAVAFSIAFSSAFLKIDVHMRKTSIILQFSKLLMIGFSFLFLGEALFDWYFQVINLWFIAVAMLIGLLIQVIGIRALNQGLKGSRFFILACSVLWLGGLVAALRIFGWLPSNVVTLYALQISSLLEMLLLAFALADIINQERAERYEAQAKALHLEKQMVTLLQVSAGRLEQEVQARTTELQQAMERQQFILDQYVRFGSLISHEFRNPLSVIQSRISLLRRQKELTEIKISEHYDIMTIAVRRLTGLFDRWLQGGRLQHLEKDLQIVPLRIDLWLGSLEQVHPQYFASHRVVLILDNLLTIEVDSFNFLGLVDERLLEMAVHNLLDNACKYSELGTEVRIELVQDVGRIGIAVIDKGVGIGNEQKSMIFADFVRLRPDGPVHGIGLGLAFVKRIATLLHGSVELHSQVGAGSTFCLWLPCVKKQKKS